MVVHRDIYLNRHGAAGVIDSSRGYHLKPCFHCGGTLYWDGEDKEWCCLNCARRLISEVKQETGDTESIKWHFLVRR